MTGRESRRAWPMSTIMPLLLYLRMAPRTLLRGSFKPSKIPAPRRYRYHSNAPQGLDQYVLGNRIYTGRTVCMSLVKRRKNHYAVVDGYCKSGFYRTASSISQQARSCGNATCFTAVNVRSPLSQIWKITNIGKPLMKPRRRTFTKEGKPSLTNDSTGHGW
jgi:hypothetical protein